MYSTGGAYRRGHPKGGRILFTRDRSEGNKTINVEPLKTAYRLKNRWVKIGLDTLDQMKARAGDGPGLAQVDRYGICLKGTYLARSINLLIPLQNTYYIFPS